MDEDAVHLCQQKGGGKNEQQNYNGGGRYHRGRPFYGQRLQGADGNRPAERYPDRYADAGIPKLRESGGNDAVTNDQTGYRANTADKEKYCHTGN